MRRFAIALTVLLAACAGPAQASISYQYVTDIGASGSTYNTTAANTSVTINVFLQETLTGGSQSLINGDGGLYGGGFYVVRSSSTGSANDAVMKVSSLTFNQTDPTSGTPPGFKGGNTSYTPNNTTQQGGIVNIGNGTIAPNTSNISNINGTQLLNTVTNSIWLGSFTILSGQLGSDTKFTLESYNNFSGIFAGYTITNNTLFDLDSTNNASGGGGATYTGASQNPFTFFVASTPEPSSILLCSVAVCGGAFAAYRRRKAKQAAATETAAA